MAEKSKQKDRYNRPPKIGKEPEKGDEDKSGHMEEDSKEAKKTAGDKGETHAEGGKASVESSVTAGTDGIPTHVRHAMERSEMLHKHMGEHHDMHRRHEHEHRMMEG